VPLVQFLTGEKGRSSWPMMMVGGIKALETLLPAKGEFIESVIMTISQKRPLTYKHPVICHVFETY